MLRDLTFYQAKAELLELTGGVLATPALCLDGKILLGFNRQAWLLAFGRPWSPIGGVADAPIGSALAAQVGVLPAGPGILGPDPAGEEGGPATRGAFSADEGIGPGALYHPGVTVWYEDGAVVVAYKPPGLPVRAPSGPSVVRALLSRGRWLSRIGAPDACGILYEMPAEVGGLVVLAKHASAHRALLVEVEEGRFWLGLQDGQIVHVRFAAPPSGREVSISLQDSMARAEPWAAG